MSDAFDGHTRVWLHSRKGRIIGEVVAQDDTWTHIRLTEDAWADVRRRHRHEAGTVQTYRTEFLEAVNTKNPYRRAS